MASIEKQIRALHGMTVGQLRERYAEVFGEPARSHNKAHLIKRVAWRIQALAEGGLSERARRRPKALVREADLRIRPQREKAGSDSDGTEVTAPFHVSPDKRLPMPGRLLRRKYKDQVIQVRVLRQGFEFDGEVYRSLSAIARKVTGSHWSGFRFFGLRQNSKEAS